MAMGITNHLRISQHYLRENWPTYLIGYVGGILLCFGIIWLSVVRGWYAFITISLALILVLVYFLIASLWSAGFVYDVPWLGNTFFNVGNIQSEDSIVQISLGRRYVPSAFCRRLTTGKVLVFDAYNPQLTPGQPLARARRLSPFISDPRIVWREVSNNILPLPDNSQRHVILVHILSEYPQAGDQAQLLSEVYRVLRPGGQLLVAEGIKSPGSVLTIGLPAFRYKSCTSWETMISKAGFAPFKKVNRRDLLCCWCFVKPQPKVPGQTTLDF